MKSNPIIVKKGPGPALPGRGARTAIPGVFPSTSRFGEQVVKLRTPSLDTYIGGGIPIGGICLISKFNISISNLYKAYYQTDQLHCMFTLSLKISILRNIEVDVLFCLILLTLFLNRG